MRRSLRQCVISFNQSECADSLQGHEALFPRQAGAGIKWFFGGYFESCALTRNGAHKSKPSTSSSRCRIFVWISLSEFLIRREAPPSDRRPPPWKRENIRPLPPPPAIPAKRTRKQRARSAWSHKAPIGLIASARPRRRRQAQYPASPLRARRAARAPTLSR